MAAPRARPWPAPVQKEHKQGEQGGEHVPAPAPMEEVQGGGHLPAPAPKERMQGVQGGGYLPAPAHQEPMPGKGEREINR